MRLRYIGLRPLDMIVKDKKYLLHEGDVVEFDPWKIRSKRLALFEPLVNDETSLTKRERKHLKVMKINKGLHR